MLFLGAGASKPLGIKTMEEMSSEFERIVDSFPDDEKKLYENISQVLGTNNLEDVLTVLDDLINDTPSVRYSRFYINKAHLESLSDLLTGGDGEFHREVCECASLREKENFNALKLKILSFIKEKCVLKKDEAILRYVVRLYDQLFELLKFKSSSIDIFTTNYDLVIEKYYDLLTNAYHLFGKKYNYVEKRDISYSDGFLFRACIGLIVGTTTENVWDPKKYDDITERVRDNAQKVPLIRLFKLHGSIDQYYQNGAIVKKDTLFRTKTVEGIYLKDSMIYPMREKEVYKDPFFELFARLKNSLLSEKICIVIGYSFGDEHIKNIFFDAVKRNQEIRIILIDPQAKRIRDDLEPIKDNIEPIEGEFGEESVFEDLNQKLS